MEANLSCVRLQDGEDDGANSQNTADRITKRHQGYKPLKRKKPGRSFNASGKTWQGDTTSFYQVMRLWGHICAINRQKLVVRMEQDAIPLRLFVKCEAWPRRYIGKACGWKHPRAPRAKPAFDKGAITRVVLSLLRDTKVGRMVTLPAPRRKAGRKAGGQAPYENVSFLSFALLYCFFLFRRAWGGERRAPLW